MVMSRWKVMAGVLGLSLGGLAAVAGPCPKPDTPAPAGGPARDSSEEGGGQSARLSLPPSPVPAASLLPPLPPPPAGTELPAGSPQPPVMPASSAPPSASSESPPVPAPDMSPPRLPVGNTSPGREPALPSPSAEVPPLAPAVPAPPPPLPGTTEVPPPPPPPVPAPRPISESAAGGTPAVPAGEVKSGPVVVGTDKVEALPAAAKPAPAAAVVPASATTVSNKFRILLRVGEGEPNFEVRCGDELLLKVACEKIDIKSPENGNGPTAVRATGRVRFVGFGAEGACDELSFLAGTGEVNVSGNVRIQVKDKLGRVESELVTEQARYRIDPCVTVGPKP